MNIELTTTKNYKELFLNNIPMLDVRSPIEFKQGYFSLSVNKPLLTDQERQLIGIEYKNRGQDAAIKLGYAIVDHQEKERRVKIWIDYLKENPEAVIYCFRGGLRSKITQQLLAETGYIVPRVTGGYKALRRFLIENLINQSKLIDFIILGGRTGTGKTDSLKKFRRSIDLEAIASHRGSAFGAKQQEQPAQITLENKLSIELLRLSEEHSARPILVEDEGGKIGSRCIPNDFYKKTEISSLVILEDSIENRISRCIRDYIIEPYQDWLIYFKDEEAAQNILTQRIQMGLNSIARRLGGLRSKEWQKLAKEGIEDFFDYSNNEKIIDLIKKLLTEYYDPMYDYQIQRKKERIIFRGTQDEIFSFLNKDGLY